MTDELNIRKEPDEWYIAEMEGRKKVRDYFRQLFGFDNSEDISPLENKNLDFMIIDFIDFEKKARREWERKCKKLWKKAHPNNP